MGKRKKVRKVEIVLLVLQLCSVSKFWTAFLLLGPYIADGERLWKPGCIRGRLGWGVMTCEVREEKLGRGVAQMVGTNTAADDDAAVAAAATTTATTNNNNNNNLIIIITIFKEEATSASAGFHAGPLSRSSWNSSMLESTRNSTQISSPLRHPRSP